MKRTAASRSFICIVGALMAAVLLLPWGTPGLDAAPAMGSPHCAAPGPGISSGSCCPPEMPDHCGASGQTGMFGCRCSSGGPAFLTLPVAVSPAWHVSTYLPSGVILSSPLFPPNIFHPPEQNRFFLPI